MLSFEEQQRYQKQLVIPNFGLEAQLKLQQANVLVVGAGGLGCPALQYLAAAGVGSIGIVDFDKVEISNLQRQVLFNVNDLGKTKATCAAEKIKLLNPLTITTVYDSEMNNQNAIEIIKDYELVLDCSDNFTTRYLVNDACVLLEKPLVYAAVLRFEGQLSVFNFGPKNNRINYRNLFPVPPNSDAVISCNDGGVLGVVPGIIGTMQAAEAIKIITGLGKVSNTSLLSYDVLHQRFYEAEVNSSSECNGAPKTFEEFQKFDYRYFCSSSNPVNEISVQHFEEMKNSKSITIIDVREEGELPAVTEFDHLHIPLIQSKSKFYELHINLPVVVFCNSGQRSKGAINELKEIITLQEVYSLKGGIIAWKNWHHERKETT